MRKMKHIMSAKVLLLMVGLLFAAMEARANPQIGQQAPEFSGKSSNGKILNLSDFKGKIVVLEWTNHLCPYVGKHYSSGNMQALQVEATGKNIVWLSIISSAPGRQGHVSAEMANKLSVDRKAVPSGIILDTSGEIGKLYKATATPNMFIIDESGKLIYKGAIDNRPSANPGDIAGAENYVRSALTALEQGQPIKKAVTRPYGCSVKYGS